MTQPTEAVGAVPNDTVVASEPSLEDRFAAVTDEEEREPGAEEAPGDLDEPIVPDDTADLEVEIADTDLPSIDPPVSLNADEKEAFKTWPREAQEAFSRRVGELEKGLHAKAQEAKSTRQSVEREAMEAIGRIETAHVETLRAMLPDIPAKPPYQLQTRDPAAFAYQMDAYEHAVAQHQRVQQIAGLVDQRLKGLAREAQTQQEAEDAAILNEKFPEYLNEASKPELRRVFQSTLRHLGYADDQIDNASAVDLLALREVSRLKAKADKYDTLMAKQMETVRAAKTLPKVTRPGSPQGKGAVANERYAADRQAMKQGDRDAESRVFARFV